jgi:hypothetical protein
MPADDLVLNVKQIAGYPTAYPVAPDDMVLIQRGGLGGPYMSTSAADLVSTALQTGGDFNLDASGTVAAGALHTNDLQSATAEITTLLSTTATIGALAVNSSLTLGGAPVATMDFVSSATVSTFNGRNGAVALWITDIIAAGGAPIYNPRFIGCPRADTPGECSNSTRLATTEFVQRACVLYINNLLTNYPLVFTFNGRSGPVTLTAADIEAALTGSTLPYAPLDSPNFSGIPTAPTAGIGNATGQIATTAFVMNAVSDSTTGVVSFNTRTGVVAVQAADQSAVGGALLASPALTGVPTAPTATGGTATTQLATTAFVAAALAGVAPGVTSFNTRTGAITLTTADVTDVGGALVASTVASFNARTGPVSLLANDISAVGGALLASPTFTGAPTAPTAAPGTNTAQLATTAFVEAALGGVTTGVVTFNNRAGAVTLTLADVTGAGGAPLASPTFTGAAASTTPTAGDATTRIATTAFVAAAIAALPAPPVASTVAPLINGVANAGVSAAWSRGDHVHPTDTTRYAASNPSGFQTAAQVTASLANYLPLSGGTLSGNLTLSGASPTISNTAPGGFIILYGGSGLYADANNFGVGESGSFAVATNWRYIFSRSTGQRVWTDFNQITLMALVGSGNLSISGTLSQASDARTKRNIVAADEGLDAVRLMQPRRYRRVHPEPPADHPGWKPEDREELGFVAQEMAAVLPHAVREHDDDTLAIELMPLIAALTNAVKELDARLVTLEGSPA